MTEAEPRVRNKYNMVLGAQLCKHEFHSRGEGQIVA
jgi:hypothetical protein